jgi:hypothetical protein
VKVFFDTNVLLDAFATRGLCADLFAHVLLEHELLTGEFVLRELPSQVLEVDRERAVALRFEAVEPSVVREAMSPLRSELPAIRLAEQGLFAFRAAQRTCGSC